MNQTESEDLTDDVNNKTTKLLQIQTNTRV